jgi:dTDP-4-dehydrorhamnose reductase
MYQRILITGANGLLGQSLIKRLSQINEYEILCTAKQSALYLQNTRCQYVSLDLCDAEAVRQVFQEFSPNVVINTAAMTMVDVCETQREACWKINVDAVDTLVSCCKAKGAKLIQLSTDFVFDGRRGPYTEKAKPNPISFYGRSKLAAENALRALPRDQWAIVRTVLVYGNGLYLSRSNFALWTFEKLKAKEEISVVTDQFRTATFVDDLAEGIAKIIEKKKRGIWHISGSEYLSVYEITKRVAQAAGLDTSLIKPTDGTKFSQAARRPPKTGFIILKAQTELGYQPKTLEEGALLVLNAKND